MKNKEKKNTTLTQVNIKEVEDKIINIRGLHVLLDRDVAALYQVETKRVNEAVRNNPERFPIDYMFELSDEESSTLRSKFSTLEWKVKAVIVSIITKLLQKKVFICWLRY